MNKDEWAEKEDMVMMPVEHNAPQDRILPADQRKLVQKGKEDSDTMAEVSVRVWFTKEFAAMEDDVQGYINTCFEEANAALANSLVPMRLKHHGTKLYDKEEIFDGGAMLNAFTDSDSRGPIQ